MRYGKGDSGETELLGMVKVWKDDIRLEVLGTLDELNSFIGLARATTGYEDIRNVLLTLQKDLFKIGSEFASLGTPEAKFYVTKDMVMDLEKMVSKYESELVPVKGFVIPSGALSSIILHIARTIARRAERRAVALRSKYDVNGNALAYLNRLSTLLFILARVVNIRSFVKEEILDR